MHIRYTYVLMYDITTGPSRSSLSHTFSTQHNRQCIRFSGGISV